MIPSDGQLCWIAWITLTMLEIEDVKMGAAPKRATKAKAEAEAPAEVPVEAETPAE